MTTLKMSTQVSPYRAVARALGWLLRFGILVMLYFALFSASGRLVAPYLPEITPEPGPFPATPGLNRANMLCLESWGKPQFL